MNNSIKELLSKFNYQTKIINVSNKNIKGILDLDEFENLEELDCSNNKITEISNIPRTLKYLNCSNNQITILNDLPNHSILLFDLDEFVNLDEFEKLEELDCSNNKITEISNIPRTLKYLNCSNNQITILNDLPNLNEINCESNPLIKLFFGNKFNKPIDNFTKFNYIY